MTKLEVAKVLRDGMRFLSSEGPFPLPQAEIQQEIPQEDYKDRLRLGRAMSAAVLSTILVELVVKHVWEEHVSKQAPHTHAVGKLFRDLSEEKREEVEKVYSGCVQASTTLLADLKEKLGEEGAIETASLEEALEWNEKAMTRFKYDLQPGEKWVPHGFLWNGQNLWVPSSEARTFGIDLVDWASS